MAAFTPASQTAEKDWEQDLADILNILEEENSTSSSHLGDNSVVNRLDEIDEGQWPSSPFQHSIGQEVSFLQTTPPLAIHNSRVSQKELQIQRTVNFLRTSGISTELKTKSNVSAFPGNEHLEVMLIDSSTGCHVAPNSTTDKAIQPAISTCPIVSDTSFKMDYENSSGVKRPIQEEIALEKNGNISTIKRKRRIPQRPKIKLFEILSMILQALANPQMTESKEHEIYVVLQKAHTEIQRMQEVRTIHT